MSHFMQGRRGKCSAALLLLIPLFLSACGPQTQTAAPRQEDDPELVKLHPDATFAGQAFNRQPGGTSAIAVNTRNAKNTTVIVFAGQPLDTVFGGDSLLSAVVPSTLYAKPGRYEVYLQTGAKKSNALTFDVR